MRGVGAPRYEGLGGAAANSFKFGAIAAEIVERAGFFHPAFVQVVADFLALVADEVKTVDALVDFLAIEHPASEFFNPNTEQILVIFLYLAAPSFVTGKVFAFGLVMGAVVDVVVGAVFGGSPSAFFLRPWHLFMLLP